MKRIVSLLVILFVVSVATFVNAQVARNPTFTREGKSNFSNLSVSGLDVNGNPGYIELVGTPTEVGTKSTVPINWYLWVDETGDLRIASSVALDASAYSSSFPTGDWRGVDVSSSTVGDQSR